MPVVEYEERLKTIELVIRNYLWPGVIKDVEKYVERFDLCQRMKNRTEIPVEKLIVNKVSEKV